MSISYLSLNESQPCTIVLIHGVTESRLEWDFVTPYLGDYHLLVVDCPGHSRSAHILPAVIPNSTDHIASLIRSHARGGKAHIVGLSMGGFITLDLARRYPELVLSAFATGAAPYEGFYKWMSVHPRFVYFMMGVLDKTPERLYWWIAERRGMKKNEELRKEMKVNSRRWEVVKDVYTSILDFGFEQAREIKVRTLAVAGGREDQVGPTRRMGEIWKEEGVKGSKAVVVRNAYHAWDLQMPELFAQGVLAWIEERDLPKEFEELT